MPDIAFADAIGPLLAEEGGYVDDPLDRGGETNRGITWPTLREAISRGLVDAGTTIKGLTRAQTVAIYEALYWRAAACDRMPGPLAIMVFDFAVLSGPLQAIKSLQETLHLDPDGVIGPATLDAVDKVTEPSLVRYAERRLAFHDDIVRRRPPQVKWRQGWRLRILRTLARCARQVA